MNRFDFDQSKPYPQPTAVRRCKHYPQVHPHKFYPSAPEFNPIIPRLSLDRYFKTLCVMSFYWKGEKQIPYSEVPKSGEEVYDIVRHQIVLDEECFTVDSGTPRLLNDPINFEFLESLMDEKCPKELEPKDKEEIHHFGIGKKHFMGRSQYLD